jgi:hypothetical protein
MLISRISDIHKARTLDGTELHIKVVADRLAANGVLRHALHAAASALAPGGELVVCNLGKDSQTIQPGNPVAPTVRMQARSVLRYSCEELWGQSGSLHFRKREQTNHIGWSIGLLYSGSDKEVDQVRHSVDAILRQENIDWTSAEIIICGPQSGESIIGYWPHLTCIRYLRFDYSDTGPFPISMKKNFIARNASYDHIALLHSRIHLQPQCISLLPKNFDIITPRIITSISGVDIENTSFVAIDSGWPFRPADVYPAGGYSLVEGRFLEALRRRVGYIDGGLIFTTKRVLAVCPFNDALRWGDCEDVEWCRRAEANGFIVELAVHSWARSATNKYRAPWLTNLFIRRCIGMLFAFFSLRR